MTRDSGFDRWTLAAAASTVVIGAAYLRFHHVQPIVSIGVPAVVYALLGRPVTTGLLGAFSILIGFFAVNVVRADDEEVWRLILQLIILAIIAIGLSFVARRWQIQVSRERDEFRLLAENASDVVLRVDSDGIIRWASPSMRQTLGLTPERLVGRNYLERVHPDDIGAARAALVVAGGERAPVTVRVRDGDGTEAWLSVTAQRMDDGTVVMGGRRIDEEVAAHRLLADSERRYRLLAENSTDIVLEAGADGVIRWASPSAAFILGIDPDQLGGRSMAALWRGGVALDGRLTPRASGPGRHRCRGRPRGPRC